MSNKAITIYAEAMKRKQEEEQQLTSKPSTPNVTRKPTRARDQSRDTARTRPRGKSRGKPRDFPTRNEIQVFSFRLRDQIKVKVQAEVPHQWHTELADIAQNLNVKKLELYRFILGEFLGKVRRRQSAERSHAANRGHQGI